MGKSKYLVRCTLPRLGLGQMGAIAMKLMNDFLKEKDIAYMQITFTIQ